MLLVVIGEMTGGMTVVVVIGGMIAVVVVPEGITVLAQDEAGTNNYQIIEFSN
jgi:hypothetical protein